MPTRHVSGTWPPECDIGYVIGQQQYIDFRGERAQRDGIQQLINLIGTAADESGSDDQALTSSVSSTNSTTNGAGLSWTSNAADQHTSELAKSCSQQSSTSRSSSYTSSSSISMMLGDSCNLTASS